jgi:uncharacterized RDD family membrane protein YckC
MSTDAPTTPPATPVGYLSEESKRRFTLVAGVMGTVFFLAQMVLPAAMMFAFMMPAIFAKEFKQIDVDGAAVWRGELWLIEESTSMKGDHTETTSLRPLSVADLQPAGPAVPIGGASTSASHVLLPAGDRLWVLGTDAVRYYEGGSITRLEGPGRLDRASRPFLHDGRPAVLEFGYPTTLSRLEVSGSQARWAAEELDLRLPQEAGMVHALQALEVDGRLLLFVQLCIESEKCTIRYRPLDATEWRLATDLRGAGEWSLVLRGAQPAVVAVERRKEEPGKRTNTYTIFTLGSEPARRESVELEGNTIAWKDWRALASGESLLLLTRRFGGNLRLDEVADGRVVRTASRVERPFPFGPGMMVFMFIPQFVPIALSLVMAYLLTTQMRRHRVGEYVHAGESRPFASLWQRALAQVVDSVPFAVIFAAPAWLFWRSFTDVEAMADKGPRFMLWLFVGMGVAFAVSALFLLVYSYLEGRFGQTPGKWLVGIRVLGTDLQPCGFGRAFLRNLLTFVDGFFNFLVGVLMVAFTENWQRLGDFAARTVVLADRRA